MKQCLAFRVSQRLLIASVPRGNWHTLACCVYHSPAAAPKSRAESETPANLAPQAPPKALRTHHLDLDASPRLLQRVLGHPDLVVG